LDLPAVPLHLRQLCRRRLCPQQPPIRWAEPMKQLFRSKAATGMGMGMGGAITAVTATTTVGTAATTMAGGIIAIGGDFPLRPKTVSSSWRPLFAQGRQSRTFAFRSLSLINRTWRRRPASVANDDLGAGCSDLNFGAPLATTVVAGIVGLIRLGFAL